MKKSLQTQSKILTFLKEHPGVSSSFIADNLSITRITVYSHLKQLIESNNVFSQGNRKLTRYFVNSHKQVAYKNTNFYANALRYLLEEYEGIENLDLISLSEDTIANLSAEGIWQYGLRALEEKIKKENNNKIPTEYHLLTRFVDFMYLYLENESKRKKYGFFSGTQSLKSVLSRYNMPVFIDKLYFCEIFSLMIGRLKWSEEIYWGKKLQNRRLLESGIQYGIDKIVTYIQENHIQYILYTPPTLPREYQFPDILKTMLRKKQVVLSEIIAEKYTSPQINFKPQKDTSGQERIVNARLSIFVKNIENLEDISEILILDDNFITGATVNAIAEKIRQQGYKAKITAITLTGSFDYHPGITDVGEI